MAFISQFSCLVCYPALNQVLSDSSSLICRCAQVQCSVVKASPSSAPTSSTPAVAGAVSDHQYEAVAWSSNAVAAFRSVASRPSLDISIPSGKFRKPKKTKRAADKSNSRMHGINN